MYFVIASRVFCSPTRTQGAIQYLREYQSFIIILGNYLLEVEIVFSIFSKDSLREFSDILVGNKTIKSLVIRKSDIGEEGLALISRALPHNFILENLNISENYISQFGLASLALALEKNNTHAE